MIVYNTHDIIKRAKSLADISNSDFISYDENVALLNDAYQRLYQKAIDSGDKIYLKEVDVDDLVLAGSGDFREQRYCLPNDFYQLHSIVIAEGNSHIPVLRRAKGTAGVTPSYDIINNELVLYGSIDYPVSISYFPILETLTIAPDNIDLPKDFKGKPIANYREHILTYDEEAKTCYHYNLKTGSMESWLLNMPTGYFKTIKTYAHCSNNNACFYMSYETSKSLKPFEVAYNFEYDDTEIETITGSISLEKELIGDDVFVKYYDDNENVKSYYLNEDGAWFFDKDNKLYYTEIYDDMTSSVTRSYTLKGTFIDFDIISEDADELVFSAYISPEAKSRAIMHLDFNSGEISYDVRTTGHNKLVISAEDFNFDTGYGMLVKTGSKYFIQAYVEDTQLDYPNNFYYSFMAYTLAISYKVKQNADPSLLASKAQTDALAYFDSLKRDANAPLRISNTYIY